MNECRRSLECINFGSFENCVQEVTIPVGCSHYVKDRELSSYSTAALVAELCSREGVGCLIAHDSECSYSLYAGSNYSCKWDQQSHGDGPAKIIVVRGE